MSPARPSACDTRPAGGIPPGDRDAVRSRLRARRDAEPCIRCNGSFRFAELLAFARRAGCDRLATGHYARVAEHRGRLLLHRGADEAKDQSYMLARLDPKELDRIWFPLGEQDKDATRAEAASAVSRSRAGPRARRRVSSPVTTIGRSSRATGSSRAPEASSTSRARRSASTTASGGSHLASARASASRRRRLCMCSMPNAATNAVIVGPHESLARRRVAASGRLYVDVGPRSREAPVSLARCGGKRVAVPGRFHARARRARLRRRARPGRCSLRGRRCRRVRSHLDHR